MDKEMKTNWDRLQEAYARMAYLRLKICETQGVLQKLNREAQSCGEQIYEVENKIIKENEEA